MPIKLAFSTVACPDWNLDQVVQRAKEMGYQGVELRTLGPGGSGLASDPALSDPAKVAAAFQSQGIEPVCLSTSVEMHHRQATELHQARRQLRAAIDLAVGLGCRCVSLFGNAVLPGQNRRAALERITENIRPLADHAGQRGIQLLFENAGSFNHAKEWWWLLNLLEHPMVGLCWNVANAAPYESPAVSVPVLNSRIRLAKVRDAQVGEGSGFLPLGEGTVGIPLFIQRLMGVGYDGYLSVDWPRLWLPSLTPAEQYLPDAAQRLRKWLDEISQAVTKGKAAAQAAAAKAAGKPKPAAAR